MILSFHPCFVGDQNILCAGREPDATDLTAIRQARWVILPQGCRQSLFEMARRNCLHVFPNYDFRFRYPGKIGQIRLFRKFRAPHPYTEIYPTLAHFKHRNPSLKSPFNQYPYIFKFNWGGEGNTVHAIRNEEDFTAILARAKNFEAWGHRGFLLQEYIPSGNRVLRVVVIGSRIISYWRVHPDTDRLILNVAGGAVIDQTSAPHLRRIGMNQVREFCKRTLTDLAGFDLLFPERADLKNPSFIEINYFFGRRGLGGGERYYHLLDEEIRNWLNACMLE